MFKASLITRWPFRSTAGVKMCSGPASSAAAGGDKKRKDDCALRSEGERESPSLSSRGVAGATLQPSNSPSLFPLPVHQLPPLNIVMDLDRTMIAKGRHRMLSTAASHGQQTQGMVQGNPSSSSYSSRKRENNDPSGAEAVSSSSSSRPVDTNSSSSAARFYQDRFGVHNVLDGGGVSPSPSTPGPGSVALRDDRQLDHRYHTPNFEVEPVPRPEREVLTTITKLGMTAKAITMPVEAVRQGGQSIPLMPDSKGNCNIWITTRPDLSEFLEKVHLLSGTTLSQQEESDLNIPPGFEEALAELSSVQGEGGQSNINSSGNGSSATSPSPSPSSSLAFETHCHLFTANTRDYAKAILEQLVDPQQKYFSLPRRGGGGSGSDGIKGGEGKVQGHLSSAATSKPSSSSSWSLLAAEHTHTVESQLTASRSKFAWLGLDSEEGSGTGMGEDQRDRGKGKDLTQIPNVWSAPPPSSFSDSSLSLLHSSFSFPAALRDHDDGDLETGWDDANEYDGGADSIIVPMEEQGLGLGLGSSSSSLPFLLNTFLVDDCLDSFATVQPSNGILLPKFESSSDPCDAALIGEVLPLLQEIATLYSKLADHIIIPSTEAEGEEGIERSSTSSTGSSSDTPAVDPETLDEYQRAVAALIKEHNTRMMNCEKPY